MAKTRTVKTSTEQGLTLIVDIEEGTKSKIKKENKEERASTRRRLSVLELVKKRNTDKGIKTPEGRQRTTTPKLRRKKIIKETAQTNQR